MKKLIILFFVLTAIGAKAQTFELTAHGFVDAKNAQHDYIVVPFEGKSQTEIFNLAQSALGRTTFSPKDRVSKVEYSQICINGIFREVTYINRMGLHLNFDMICNIIFEFKDGRMKINGPIINDIIRDVPLGSAQHMYLTTAERGSALGGDLALFDKNGKVKEKKHKANIEDAINAYVINLISEMNNIKDSDW